MHSLVLKALSDPRRFEIVEMLGDGEHSVSDIVGRLGIDQSGVSRHLHKLLDAGIVEVRRDGQRRLYSLRPDPLQTLAEWIDKYRALWDARFDRLEGHLQKKRT